MDWSKWDYYQDFEIDPAQVDADLTDFPVYLNGADLPSDHKIWTDAQASGGDVKASITDDTEIPIEIVTFDQAGNDFQIHVKLTTVSSTIATTARLNFANPADTAHAEDATYGSENVWNSDYLGVWHLDEDGNTDVGGYLDSTANDNDGTGVLMTGSSDVDAILGKGQDFTGAGDYIDTGIDDDNKPTGASTMSMWGIGEVSSGGSFTGIGWSGNTPKWGTLLGADDGDRAGFQIVDSGITPYSAVKTSMSPATDAAWYHYTGVFVPSTSVKLYLDGAEAASNTTSIPATQYTDTDVNFMIGRRGDSSYQWDGIIDEVRISETDLSADWISTEFNNQDSSSTFYSLPRAIQRHRNRIMSSS